ncbi:MAG: D-lactate dehydrogenase [Solirubrobacterales bacterium]|jgi:D-lactate dehydrogenase|nr:D-lactate dehydrogenase [Solirubrobacterales bacterium]
MKLLEPDVMRIAPEPAEPAADRAPDWVAAGTPASLAADLERLLGPDRLLGRASDLVRYASDASPYRLFPKAVIRAREAGDVAKVLAYGRESGIPVTLRAAGTSLNGQGQGDGILVDVRRHFNGVTVEEDGAAARVLPGTILGHANRVLAPYSRRLGPDPASTDAASVGGVIANNSGGMRCGVVADSYSTLRALTFVLPSGTLIDTAAPGAADAFAAAEPDLAAGLAEIRDEIRGDEELAARIRRKFAIKNTTGYRLCAFLDADEPLEIFRRLLVGSEGTLAFVAEAVFDTVPLRPHTATSWIHFADIDAAAAPVPALVAAGASAVELMVAPALMVAANSIPGTPEHWKELDPASAALLVEFRSDDPADLDGFETAAAEALGGHELLRGPEFTRDVELTELYWRVREGMHGLVGRLRPQGTALIIEDVCVAPERMAESAADIRELLGKHGFLPGVAGHASAGNLHFMLTPDFSVAADRDRYEAFMAELVDLVVDKYDGSLKAEHGTGRNMAPYVEREWGAKATELMWRVKQLADPDGVLAPGVLLNRDPGVHLRDLKTTPPIEEVADPCVECGFCESVCPSRLLTTTPRERIVLRREMARQPPGSPVQRALLEQYQYDGIETCAADGSCELACPLSIDTGKLVKEFRRREHDGRAQRAALRTAERWASVERASRGGLRMGAAISRLLGDAPLRGLTRAQRHLLSTELVPEWGEAMPRSAPGSLPETSRDGAAAVYVPACINRIFGNSSRDGDGPTVVEAMVAVSSRAGQPLWIPDDVAGSCCSMPWSSKGYTDAHAFKANEMIERLWRWSDEGALPVVIDATSCVHGLTESAAVLSEENAARAAQLTILDPTRWAGEHLLAGLSPRRLGSVAVHPTCSSRHLGLTGALRALAAALADDVHVPIRATCCGFAGDRGFLHPELTEAATLEEAAELEGREFDAYVSSNRTCELGLERGTGKPYRSIVQLLEEQTRRPT